MSVTFTNELYCDGGVLTHNPSKSGGMWAWIWVINNEIYKTGSGYLWPKDTDNGEVTNNHTEMMALLEGFKVLPDNWVGRISSDSKITLERVFGTWAWKGIPEWMHRAVDNQIYRLYNWHMIEYRLLQGHPTRKELECGMGHKGYPVSRYNVMCDANCNVLRDQWLNKEFPEIHSWKPKK